MHDIPAQLRDPDSILHNVFRLAPTFMAVLRGPTYVHEMANDAYYRVIGDREIIGKPLFEALPEVRGQGFEELLAGVVTTGEPFVGREVPVMIARTPGGVAGGKVC